MTDHQVRAMTDSPQANTAIQLSRPNPKRQLNFRKQLNRPSVPQATILTEPAMSAELNMAVIDETPTQRAPEIKSRRERGRGRERERERRYTEQVANVA